MENNFDFLIQRLKQKQVLKNGVKVKELAEYD